MIEIGFIDKYEIKGGVDYIIIPIGDTVEYCIKILKILQNKNYSASIYFEENSLKKKMNFADKSGALSTIIIGEDEVKNNEFTIRNMKTGESKKMKLEEL